MGEESRLINCAKEAKIATKSQLDARELCKVKKVVTLCYQLT